MFGDHFIFWIEIPHLYREAIQWCFEEFGNCYDFSGNHSNYLWATAGNKIFFHKEDDLILFKMKWN